MFDAIQNWDLRALLWVGQFHSPVLIWTASILSLLSAKAATIWLIIPILWVRRHKALAAESFLALGISAFLGLLIKPMFARQRPDVVAAQMADKPIPEFLTTHHSFPSGHTLLIAAAAYIITLRCRKSISIPFWILTLLVCWARVYDKMHWPTDSIGGVVLGIAFGALTHWIWQRKIPDYFLNTKLARAIPPLKLVSYFLEQARKDDAQRSNNVIEFAPKQKEKALQSVR